MLSPGNTCWRVQVEMYRGSGCLKQHERWRGIARGDPHRRGRGPKAGTECFSSRADRLRSFAWGVIDLVRKNWHRFEPWQAMACRTPGAIEFGSKRSKGDVCVLTCGGGSSYFDITYSDLVKLRRRGSLIQQVSLGLQVGV